MRRIVQRTNAALALQHCNVARVYNIGKASGECFLSTEYIHGEVSSRPKPKLIGFTYPPGVIIMLDVVMLPWMTPRP